jgi:rhamnosyltransferase
MSKPPKISIIIRARNEERWIGVCLRAVMAQSERDFEVILVDNDSRDHTVAKAKAFDLKLVSVQRYLPGYSLNQGIRASSGEFIVCLSGHCIPVDEHWLARLIEGFEDDTIAGIYGRQEPLAFSSDADKRDLLITFGLDRRIQVKDSFFHNANSALRRQLWERFPFDETATNIEDRIWAHQVIKAGFKIVYEPAASVYHHHGIHHAGNAERAASTVRVLEQIGEPTLDPSANHIDLDSLDVIAVVPVRDGSMQLAGRPLYLYTIEHALRANHVDRVYVATADPEVARQATALGAHVPFLTSEENSRFDVILERLMQAVLHELEARNVNPDVFVMLEPQYPFRNPALIDELVTELVTRGFDTMIPAREDYNSCWLEQDGGYRRIDEGYLPREFKKPVLTGLKGLCCVTHAAVIREGQLFGDKVGIHKIQDSIATIEVISNDQRALAELIMVNRAAAAKLSDPDAPDPAP